MKTPHKINMFYQSVRWHRVRALIIQQSRGRCSECGKAGNEVHHKIPLTLSNIDDPLIALDSSNLELLCHDCHLSKRGHDTYIRDELKFDASGNVVLK
jgi:5-methylcytosine-specific restriction endonuclease McrA